jgi:ribose 5-phosphate isomerase B
MVIMKVYLATDHAGFSLKESLKPFLADKGYMVEDCGAYSFQANDDYPDFIAKAAKAVSADPDAKAIIFGGSGQAEAMVANKFPHVRAAVFYSPVVPTGAADVAGRVSSDRYEMIRLTREHNDANVLSLGVRFLTEEEAKQAVVLWLETPFSEDERHVRRIQKIKTLETQI